MHTFYGTVYAVAYSILREREAAEDLAQEVFLRCYIHLNSLKRSDAFGPWVVRITRNLAFDWRKSHARASKLVQFVEAETAALENMPDNRHTQAEQILNDEAQARLYRMILDLPQSQREIVLLHYGEDLPLGEAARRLGIAPSTVSRQLQRAHRNLRQMIAPDQLRSTLSADESQRTKQVARVGAVVAALAGLSVDARAHVSAAATLSKLSSTSAGLGSLSAGGKVMIGATAALVIGAASYFAFVAGAGVDAGAKPRGTAAGNSVVRDVQPNQGTIATLPDSNDPVLDNAQVLTPQSTVETVAQGAPISALTLTTSSADHTLIAQTSITPHGRNATTVDTAPITPNSSTPPPLAQPVVSQANGNTGISGRLIGEDGTPISGAFIRVLSAPVISTSPNISNSPPPNGAQTGADGSFTIAPLDPGTVRLMILTRGSDYVPLLAKEVTAPAKDLEIKLAKEGGVIEGRVIDEVGKGVPFIEVRLGYLDMWLAMPAYNVLKLAEVRTDANGFFRMEKLPVGVLGLIAIAGEKKYGLKTTLDFFRSQRMPTHEEYENIYIKLGEKETTSGILLVPAPPTPAFPGAPPPPPASSTPQSSNLEGAARLTASSQIPAQTIPAQTTPPHADARITGTVTTESGAPVAGKTIMATYEVSGKSGEFQRLAVKTAADGSFTAAPVPPGRVRFMIIEEGFVPVLMKEVTAPASDVEIKLASEGAVIEGQVVDENGVGVPLVEVQIGYLDFQPMERPSPQPRVAWSAMYIPTTIPKFTRLNPAKTQTDPTGFFHFDRLPAGTYGPFAKANGKTFTIPAMAADQTANGPLPRAEWEKRYITVADRETKTGILLSPTPPRPER